MFSCSCSPVQQLSPVWLVFFCVSRLWKLCSPPDWEVILLCYFLEALLFFLLQFRSFIHLELIFVFGLRHGSRSILFPYGYSITPAPFIEKTIPSPLNCRGPLSLIMWLCKCGSVSRLSVLFLSSLCQSLLQSYSVLITVAF